jgi:hypothetical protein
MDQSLESDAEELYPPIHRSQKRDSITQDLIHSCAVIQEES